MAASSPVRLPQQILRSDVQALLPKESEELSPPTQWNAAVSQQVREQVPSCSCSVAKPVAVSSARRGPASCSCVFRKRPNSCSRASPTHLEVPTSPVGLNIGPIGRQDIM